MSNAYVGYSHAGVPDCFLDGSTGPEHTAGQNMQPNSENIHYPYFITLIHDHLPEVILRMYLSEIDWAYVGISTIWFISEVGLTFPQREIKSHTPTP